MAASTPLLLLAVPHRQGEQQIGSRVVEELKSKYYASSKLSSIWMQSVEPNRTHSPSDYSLRLRILPVSIAVERIHSKRVFRIRLQLIDFPVALLKMVQLQLLCAPLLLTKGQIITERSLITSYLERRRFTGSPFSSFSTYT